MLTTLNLEVFKSLFSLFFLNVVIATLVKHRIPPRNRVRHANSEMSREKELFFPLEATIFFYFPSFHDDYSYEMF